MLRNRLRAGGAAFFGFMALGFFASRGGAIPLDKDGDIKVGVRTYVNARIGTENTHQGVLLGTALNPSDQSTSATWPKSNAGHLRQNRFFVEAELKHDLNRLQKSGVGPMSLLNDLPFQVRNLGYGVTFRAEGDGLYDWGPKEYSTARENLALQRVDPPNALVNKNGTTGIGAAQTTHDPLDIRKRLRSIGTHRERLFQAYVEGNVGDLFLRFGRQVLSWGETDGFRLLDNINPLDSSFGGFLISLDERRVPLDMLRAQYYIGDLGPFSEAFLEGYGAIDNKVSYVPGTPAGSPWTLPSVGAPSNDTQSINIRPARTFHDARGGVRLVFNAFDATFSLAHYYTYQDVEALQVITSGFYAHERRNTLLSAFEDHLPCGRPDNPSLPDYSNRNCGYPTKVFHTAPLVQVSGITTTFALPQFYSVVRSELAYFKDQAAFTQGQLDPFLFNLSQPQTRRQQTGGVRTRDSINFVLGVDRNQWIRWLNPNQTFFISTQFFFKHIKRAAGDQIRLPNGKLNPDREVLPLNLDVDQFQLAGTNVGRLEPVFISNPADQFLQTFFITTSFYSGQVSPSMTVFYDWSGAFVYQPSLTLSRDPFRFSIDYSVLDSHIYKGGSGVSLLKDRDNVQFRVEYVI